VLHGTGALSRRGHIVGGAVQDVPEQPPVIALVIVLTRALSAVGTCGARARTKEFTRSL
jgi:hypothetical protein